ncbi:MAG TPA: phosphatidylglycerol lysyltransferase domain-containing protein [Terriglobia bacterium]|nr:phosphatidylglycerol lysyltransferase domain-containing protein [Terriglobia bacterium]
MHRPADIDHSRPVLQGSFVARWRPIVSRVAIPLLAIGLFGLAVWTIHHSIAAIRFAQIRREIVAIPGDILLLSLGLTGASFLALAFQDYVALWSTGKRISFWRAALGSFIAQSVAHSTGFSILIGGALRCRYYMAQGLSFADTMKVQLSFSGTFGMATCILLGLSFLLDPSLAEAQVAFLPAGAVRILGVLLLLGPAAVFIWRTVHIGPLRILGRQIDMPDTRHLLPQTLLSLTDVACMGAVLYVFLPAGLHISYPALIGFFAIAMTIGVTSHVPGGLGVFEATILLLVSPPAELLPALVSALVMFRFIYYFVPLILGGLGVAVTEGLRHRGRLRALSESVELGGSPVAPMVFAMLTFLAGTFLLASSALPGTHWRLALLNSFLPQGLLESANLLSAVGGTLLLLLGRALSRRLRQAWWSTEILLAVNAVLALAKGLDYEVAALSALLFVALLPCKSQFYRSGRLIDQRLTPVWLLGIVAVVAGMCWLLVFAYRHLDYNQVALMQFELQRHAPRSLRAVAIMLVTLAGALIWQSLRAIQPRLSIGGDIDYRRLHPLIDRSPRASAHLALVGDKSLLWTEDASACLSYGVKGHSLIAIGDPVGPASKWGDLIWDLRDLADSRGGRVIFFDVGGEQMPIYLDLGLQALRLGVRSYLSLASFDPASWLAGAAPQAALPAEGSDLTLEICRGGEVDRIMSEIAAISDKWLEHYQLREPHLIHGHFSRDYIAHCPVAVLRDHGVIVAFAVLWTSGRRQECEIDLLRWLPMAAADVPAQLLAGLLAWAKQEGIGRFALGLQPAVHEADPRAATFWHEATRAAGQKLTAAYLLTAHQQELPLSSEASYLLYPLGELGQGLQDLTDLVTGSRSGV